MHRYRSHTCNELSREDIGQTVRVSGWVNSKRDHGNLLFIDLRDHYGLTQVVTQQGDPAFELLARVRSESVLCVTGKVIARDEENRNPSLKTGDVEVTADEVEVLSAAEVLPMQVAGEQHYGEDLRLRNRYIDLRRDRLHQNIVLRSKIISSLRRRMIDQGFMEFQTPILTASSPEGARDYVVPSRVHPGKFYALPQAPQQFKQLLMVSGFDRYFQIAPCFRDEDARADRSPGEFYQLDVEMSFVDQEDVFAAVEPVMHGVFEEFTDWNVTAPPFPRIPYKEAMIRYGSDKPDLRNPIEIADVTDVFRTSGFKTFATASEQGKVVRAIPAPAAAGRARNWFDKLVKWVTKELKGGGLAYVMLAEAATGPIAKFLSADEIEGLRAATSAKDGDVLFFVCDRPAEAARLAGALRDRLGADLELLEQKAYKFCWIVDYPMFEKDEETDAIEFSHNPFSMPQGGLDALENKDPLDVLAYQYDIVCNGVELSSGAIRNHRPDIMVRAFEMAGYSSADVEEQFGGLFRAFTYGAPPHGGLAPGVDRIVMLIADEPNIREVIAFPMAQNAQDLLMNAPCEISEKHLREIHIKLDVKKADK